MGRETNGRAPRGFTLVETLVAISLLSVAIVAPIELTVQSLASAYYARDQITAYYLAQEAIESVRHIRDGNILQIAKGTKVDIFNGITTDGTPFTIDARTDKTAPCGPSCPLDTNGTLYGYDTTDAGWRQTNFTRTVAACYVQPGTSNTCNSTPSDEARISVTVSWKTGSYKQQSFTISENLYRWVQDGSGP